MIHLCLPVGSDFGWGVCGQYLAQETARLLGPDQVRLVSPPFSVKDVGDELAAASLAGLAMSPDQALEAQAGGGRLTGPMVQAVDNASFLPVEPRLRGRFNLGYTFFERGRLGPDQAANLRRTCDLIAAGSTWCRDILAGHGLTAETLIQGVDPALFNPTANEKTVLTDRFVVFSGGKLELRKGQDLVVAAFKIFSERHPEALLVNAWYNKWPETMLNLVASPHVVFRPVSGNYFDIINRFLADNGVEPSRVLSLPPKPQGLMARIYKNTDLGLFPNRCEGGTNLVLMEYLACGKPAVVANATGHRDVVDGKTAILLDNLRPADLPDPDGVTIGWQEPDLDELIEQMEWAFDHPAEAAAFGQAAGRAMSKFTWQASAERMLGLIPAEFREF